MSLFTKFHELVRSWRRRRVVPKTSQRASIAIEQLGHRQLMAVNFTGNVITDFPATEQPGVVILPDNPSVLHPIFPTGTPAAKAIANIVKVSGFDISGVALSYTPTDDTLSIGIIQPPSDPSNPSSRPVIAGDADNNGDSATINPAITAILNSIGAPPSSFTDPADLGGTESLGAFIKLNPLTQYDVLAGFAQDSPAPKQYTVALANDQTTPGVDPGTNFGTPLAGNTGTPFLVNSKANPNFEFSITHFSQLYKAQTGQALTATSVFSIGAFGGSQQDLASGALYPLTQVSVGSITVPTPVPPIIPPVVVCPPVSPNILINPHQARHVNTAHNGDIKVYVLGSSGFPVANIDPNSVRLGGATPVSETIRKVNRDEFPDAVFVFKGNQITLPPGITVATLTGQATSPADPTKTISFSSSETIFNRDLSFYSPSAVARQQARLGSSNTKSAGDTSAVTPATSMPGMSATPATVSIPIRVGKQVNPNLTVVTPATPSPASDGSLKPLTTKIPLRTNARATMPVVKMAPHTQHTAQPPQPRGTAARSMHINNVKLKGF